MELFSCPEYYEWQNFQNLCGNYFHVMNIMTLQDFCITSCSQRLWVMSQIYQISLISEHKDMKLGHMWLACQREMAASIQCIVL